VDRDVLERAKMKKLLGLVATTIAMLGSGEVLSRAS
jgi:hypothetical protein